MALLVLLTPEQVELNRELFQRAPTKGRVEPAPTVERYSVDARGTQSTLAFGHSTVKSGYPPPPTSTIFSDPKYHENVISTFFSTAQQAVGYSPNLPGASAEQEAQGFSNWIEELRRYGWYLSLEHSRRHSQEHTSSSCSTLLNSVSGFIEAVERLMGATNAQQVAAEITSAIRNAVTAIGSSSTERVEKTLYSVSRVNGDVVGRPYPVGNIFWGTIVMERHQQGKSTVQRQTINLYSYSYMILSPIVVANADALAAAAVVPVERFVNNTNRHLPS